VADNITVTGDALIHGGLRRNLVVTISNYCIYKNEIIFINVKPVFSVIFMSLFRQINQDQQQ